jgi:hypothetical protein
VREAAALQLIYEAPAVTPSAEWAEAVVYDEFTRAKCRQFIGSIAVAEAVDRATPETTTSFSSLLEALQAAEAGDELAIKSVQANTRTAVTEAIYKAGHVITIRSDFQDDGSLIQFGQSHKDVYRNALTHMPDEPAVKARTLAETLNGHRIEDWYRAGDLEDYYLVVPSLYPDDMDDVSAHSHGFFTEYKTAVFQVTTVTDGECITEAAFVAGGANADTPRHDIVTIKKLYDQLGLDASQMTVIDFIANPLRIPKTMMPNGVVDFVRWFDEAAEDTLFFGQAAPVQDYISYLDVCAERQAKLETLTNTVTQGLIKDAGQLKTPKDATNHMYQLVKQGVVRHAAQNASIDASIFGPQASRHINDARAYYDLGLVDRANHSVAAAEQVADVTICGDGGKKKEQSASGKKSEVLRCVTCPLCGREGVDAHIRYEDNAKTITCSKCRQSKTYED